MLSSSYIISFQSSQPFQVEPVLLLPHPVDEEAESWGV